MEGKVNTRFWLVGYIVLISMQAASQALPAAADQLFFKTISTDQGLSQPVVNDIMRDSRGFIWVATEDGLNRLAGNECKVYRHNPEDASSISHSVIQSIEEEEGTGNLWVGTTQGLNYFDRTTERFTRFDAPHKPGTAYINIVTDKEHNRLWLACGPGGLQYLDLQTRTIHPAGVPELAERLVWTVVVKGDSLLAGTLEDGLRIMSISENKILHTLDVSTTPGLGNNSVRSLLVDGSIAWIGTQGAGLFRFDMLQNSVQQYSIKSQGINNDDVWSLAQDGKRNIWIGTDGGGLNILAPGQTEARCYTQSEFDDRTLSVNTIRCIYLEASGDAWLGTYNGGVCYHPATQIRFELYRKELNKRNTLPGSGVGAFAEAPDGTIWIGTDGGGLCSMKGEEIVPYDFPADTKPAGVILALEFDKQGGLWMGTYQDGLFHKDIHGKVTQYKYNEANLDGIGSNIVWSIQVDDEGFLWIGTDRGVNRLNPATGTFNNLNHPLPGAIGKIFSFLQAQTIFIASDKTLWIGSFGTLSAYFPARDSLAVFSSVTTNKREIGSLRVMALEEDKDHNIWVGTYGNGLCRYAQKTGTFSILDERDGLPNNNILSMAIEHDGIWLTTSSGLSHLNLKDTAFTTFDTSYGLQGKVFTRGSAFQTRDGHMLFGGIKGFNRFKPAKIVHDLAALQVVFTDFLLFNESVVPGQSFLKRSIAETGQIDLPFEESGLLTFRFSSLNFLSPDKVLYSYRLEGLADQWQSLGDDHDITFTSLDPGVYTLSVRASLNGRLWGTERSLLLRIRAPWYMTWQARAGGFLFVVFIGMAIARFRTLRLIRRKRELEILVDEKNAEIKKQNDELAAQNEELVQQNEEMMAQKDMIADQNKMLIEAKRRLQELNQNLEITVDHRTRRLNDTIGQLNKTIKELDAFVYSASHDLVAPLKSVLGLVDLARNEVNRHDVNGYLDYITLSIKKLENVIKSMIQYSRNSQLDIQVENVDLCELVTECVDEVKFMSGASIVKFDLQVPDGCMVMTDRQRVKIVMSNLVSNAVKYRDVLKADPLVRVAIGKNRLAWTLTVSDNGIGIDKPYLGRVFEMFYRATEKAQGSGLGLYIVKETIDRLQGDIQADSEKGQWTRFVVSIPYPDQHV